MMINGHNNQSDYSEKMKKCYDYIHALEEERTKIQVFQRELPLCLHLVTQAIETCKQQLSGTTATDEYNSHGKSECSSEQISSHDDVVPVLEQFMPIKRADSDHGEEVLQDQSEEINNEISARYNKDGKFGNYDKNSKKSDWLKSVQLWNQTPDPPSKQESPRKSAVVEVKKSGSGGAFHPFKKEKSAGGGAGGGGAQPASTSSTADTGGSSGGATKKEGQNERKARRCWSPELHRRFLHALQQLGGAHVGTPKQIRELMKVDGLTNDEVKSHLQKYRLHTRRPSTSSHNNNNNNNNSQTPQFVVVGGIWMQPEYAGTNTTTTMVEESGSGAASKKIYAPVAAPPQPPVREAKQKPSSSSHSDERGGNNSEGSASTHITTATQSH